MSEPARIIQIDLNNVEKEGFFCQKSKPKAEGYRRKLAWLEQRFREGLQIHILQEGKRQVGFIEFIPAEHAWRGVQAPNYLVIHCLWVVGKSKGQGYGRRLLETCLETARQTGRSGVAMVVSNGTWLADGRLLGKHGFEIVDRAGSEFELAALAFDANPRPAFPKDWQDRSRRLGEGLIMTTSDQCPYLDAAETMARQTAERRGLSLTTLHWQDAAQLQAQSPTPYGIFSLTFNGRAITHHWEPEDKLGRQLEDAIRNTN